MNYSKKFFRVKSQFKNLNYYSIPNSILFIVRKRLNFICYIITISALILCTIF